MKAKQLKKLFMPVLSLSLVSMLTTIDVRAMEDADGANVETSVQTISEDENLPDRINLRMPKNHPEGQRLQVTKGSNLDRYGIEVWGVKGDSQAAGMFPLENAMVSDFDNMALGVQDVKVIYKGLETVLPIEVIDGQAPCEIMKLQCEEKDDTLTLPKGITKDWVYDVNIVPVDALGRIVYNMNEFMGTLSGEAFTFSEFDTNSVGKQEVTVTYRRLSTKFTLEVLNMCMVTPEQSISVGGKLDMDQKVQMVDADNPDRVIHEEYMGRLALDEYWNGLVDNTKEGVQNIPFSISELNWYYMWLDIPGTMKVTVGTPSQSESSGSDNEVNKGDNTDHASTPDTNDKVNDKANEQTPGESEKLDNNNTVNEKAPDTGDMNMNVFDIAGLLGAIVFGALAAFKMKKA